MNKMFSLIALFLVTMVIACAQTKQFTPQPITAGYTLSGMPSSLVNVHVQDLRANRDNSEALIQSIKSQILNALSQEKPAGQKTACELNIDIIEHRSFFTLGNWNASTKFRINLIDAKKKMLGNWVAVGSAQRSNMWGYSTAQAVSQDAYNIAIADLMSILSSVSL